MADNIQCVVNVGSLPPAAKFPDWQTLVNEIGKILNVYLPGAYSPINYGSTTPTAENQDRPWVRTNVDGSPDRRYVFFNGKWVARHPIDPASDERRIWVGTEVALRSHDGGDGTADVPTATTGAMWEIDTAFAGKFPVGVGSFAASGDVAVTGSTTSTAVTGEDKHALTEAEGPEHQHFISNLEDINMSGSIAAGLGSTDYMAVRSNNASNQGYALQGTADVATVGKTSTSGSGDAHNNLPPFYGVYIIKRTGRYFYTP